MSEFEFRTTADADEFATAIWESVGNGVDEKIEDQAWDAVSRQVSELVGDEAWDAVQDNVYDAAREAVEEYGGSVDSVEETLSDLLRQYNEVSVGTHCTIGERATALVTKVIQWHLDTSFEDGGLLSSQTVMNPDEVAYVELEAKVAELTGMVSRLLAESHGFRPKYDTPEGTLAQAESTLKHILMAVQDSRGHAVNSGEPF